jgi:hypothetical protein
MSRTEQGRGSCRKGPALKEEKHQDALLHPGAFLDDIVNVDLVLALICRREG